MAQKSYYIKERHNPQTGVYYQTQGQLTKKEVKVKEKNSIYGTNYFLEYKTKEEYEKAIIEFKEKGYNVIVY